ncbi:hypothetical protein SNEBB_001909 [Seison nebaliae]|nr:hypothetical protein SNEBB_001909 [Seison nebaliae]
MPMNHEVDINIDYLLKDEHLNQSPSSNKSTNSLEHYKKRLPKKYFKSLETHWHNLKWESDYSIALLKAEKKDWIKKSIRLENNMTKLKPNLKIDNKLLLKQTDNDIIQKNRTLSCRRKIAKAEKMMFINSEENEEKPPGFIGRAKSAYNYMKKKKEESIYANKPSTSIGHRPKNLRKNSNIIDECEQSQRRLQESYNNLHKNFKFIRSTANMYKKPPGKFSKIAGMLSTLNKWETNSQTAIDQSNDSMTSVDSTKWIDKNIELSLRRIREDMDNINAVSSRSNLVSSFTPNQHSTTSNRRKNGENDDDEELKKLLKKKLEFWANTLSISPFSCYDSGGYSKEEIYQSIDRKRLKFLIEKKEIERKKFEKIIDRLPKLMDDLDRQAKHDDLIDYNVCLNEQPKLIMEKRRLRTKIDQLLDEFEHFQKNHLIYRYPHLFLGKE